MKQLLVLVLLFSIALSAGAQDRQSVGSFHAMDGANYKDMTVDIWTNQTGNILINTPTPYTLTPKDKDALIPLLQKAIRYMQVAKDNSTTVDFQKNVGSMLTDEGAYVVVKFKTSGWEHSRAEVWIYEGGRNTILSISAKEVNDMVSVLLAAVGTATTSQRQIALFNK
jgi:hypothetical protein